MATSPAPSGSGAEPDMQGRRVIVGVTGGIAAYKSCTLVSRLAQAGAQVTVCMTEASTKFVTPLTFQALAGRPVYTDQWTHTEASDPQHIATASAADLAIVAPCTMDFLAKLATGRTDDVVTLVLSAIDRVQTPVLLAPSMNEVMWKQLSTQRNVEQLIEDGFEMIGPADGWQACRAVGPGRMVEPEELYEAVQERVLVS
ncbi:MAG: flavoprotein [Planctomycetota bacterium]